MSTSPLSNPTHPTIDSATPRISEAWTGAKAQRSVPGEEGERYRVRNSDVCRRIRVERCAGVRAFAADLEDLRWGGLSE